MHASLHKAKLCEQRSQYDAALQIYQCLLRLVPSHPQFNDLKGALLIQMGRPAQAIQPLEIAWSHEPRDPQHWLRLVAACYRSGRVAQARQLLVQGQDMGIEPDLLQKLTHDLSEPAIEETTALAQLIDSGNRISAEIAARMMVQEYPSSATAKDCWAQELEMEAVNVT